jgi:hypothetical protein
MEFIKKAFKELWPNEELGQEISVKYSGKFSDYNAKVAYSPFRMSFRLSKEWRGVDEDIRIGLIQSLLIKVFRPGKSGKYGEYNKCNKIGLYESFLKNVALVAPRKESAPELIEAFNRVNDIYFYGLIDMPNLVWGQHSIRKLGSYEYGSDTVSVSKILKEAPLEYLEYVLYHELLHKKHKFYHKNGKSFHHTHAFRTDEKKFKDAEQIEKNMKSYLRKKRLKNAFFGIFG